MEKQKEVFIATYGSLRRNMQNFRVNERGGGTFFAAGKTKENFDLFRYGSAYFPSVSLIHNDAKKPVVVDVFKTTEEGMRGAYDSLEGYPSFYNRTEVDVVLDSGEEIKAWIYHIDQQHETLVPSGDWCLYLRGEDYYSDLES